MAKCLLNFYKDLHFILNIEQKEREIREGRKRINENWRRKERKTNSAHIYNVSIKLIALIEK